MCALILNTKFSPASPTELFASSSFLLELVRSKLLIHTVHSNAVLFSFLSSDTSNVLRRARFVGSGNAFFIRSIGVVKAARHLKVEALSQV